MGLRESYQSTRGLLQALTAGFKELNKRYGMHANPLDYINNDPWVIGNSSPMVLGIDAIVEAGMIPNMAIDLDNDARVRLSNT